MHTWTIPGIFIPNQPLSRQEKNIQWSYNFCCFFSETNLLCLVGRVSLTEHVLDRMGGNDLRY
jgi:hypothetical protein